MKKCFISYIGTIVIDDSDNEVEQNNRQYFSLPLSAYEYSFCRVVDIKRNGETRKMDQVPIVTKKILSTTFQAKLMET